MSLQGLKSLLKDLEELKHKVGKKTEVTVIVGFTQAYAIWVHEIDKNYRVGQWKYLETPARELAPQIGAIIAKAIENGASMEDALIIVGLRLQREAQLLCPIDTGALRASAFTAEESKAESAAAAALAISQTKTKKPKK